MGWEKQNTHTHIMNGLLIVPRYYSSSARVIQTNQKWSFQNATTGQSDVRTWYVELCTQPAVALHSRVRTYCRASVSQASGKHTDKTQGGRTRQNYAGQWHTYNGFHGIRRSVSHYRTIQNSMRHTVLWPLRMPCCAVRCPRGKSSFRGPGSCY